MLNIEVIKFEAQDVITASGVVEQKPAVQPEVKPHVHEYKWTHWEREDGQNMAGYKCECGESKPN